MNSILWQPKEEELAKAQLTQFSELVSKKYSVPISSYHQLYDWSINNSQRFWEEVWSFCDLRASKKASTTLRNPERVYESLWFEDAELNFAENLLRHRGAQTAIQFRSELGVERSLSFDELRHDVACVAEWLQAEGITHHDRVAAFMPNTPETVVAMLAASSFGAVWSSCSPDFGIDGVFDRFGQIEPRVLVAADGYTYNGKRISCLDKILEIAQRIPSIERIVLVANLDEAVDGSSLPNTTLWSSIVAQDDTPELQFAQLPFNHPLYILYSSGTTGAPKCIVHGAGGTLLQHLKELQLHCDVRSGDRIYYHTTCGWMMWNWLVSSLAVGATIYLFDGSPFHPSPNVLWDYCDDYDFSVFGTAAKYLSALEKAGSRPAESHSLSSLRALLSTGSPLLPEQFDYVYQHVKEDLLLGSISGGSDIVSLFVGSCPTLPVHRGEIQCRCLGMNVKVFDENQNELIDEEGELVCVSSFPCKPIYFWNDPEGKNYFNAYFSQYENVWRHGDWCRLTPNNGIIIYGRSDATLNPGGVRIGTADIYRQVEAFEAVNEAIAIGQEWEGDTRIVLFVRMQPGQELSDELSAEIKNRIRQSCSPRHVPAKILAVPEIPRTISGKIVEIAVRNIIHGRPVKNADALANPQALDYFRDLPELQTP